MNPQGERWTAEQVLALAPDATSRKAGGTLATPGPSGPWSETRQPRPGRVGAVRGQRQQAVPDSGGSARSRHIGAVARAGSSRASTHWLCCCSGRLRRAVPIAAQPPDWAEQWLSERRERTRRQETGTADPTAGRDSRAGRPGGGPPSGRAARPADRAGASELEQRLTDLLRDGLAGADGAGYAAWEETAARMVDAQAPGLASRVREMGAVPASGPGWPGRLLEECALVHLLNQSMLHIDQLPAELAATARSRVGFTIDTAEVLAKGTAVRDRWLVLGHQDSGDGKLTTRRIWLRGERTGRMALLLSFGAAGRSPELALPSRSRPRRRPHLLPGGAPAARRPGHRPRRACPTAAFRGRPVVTVHAGTAVRTIAGIGLGSVAWIRLAVSVGGVQGDFTSTARRRHHLGAGPLRLGLTRRPLAGRLAGGPLPGDSPTRRHRRVAAGGRRSGTALPVDPQCSGRSSRGC